MGDQTRTHKFVYPHGPSAYRYMWRRPGRSQAVPGHGPEDHRQRNGARRDEDGHPDRTANEELLDVRLSDMKRAEGR